MADINQIGILLIGIVLGWMMIFAVRRYRVHWGAFAGFVAVLFGTGILSFLLAKDLLAYYGIGMFVGFFANITVRVVGIRIGGKVGEGLLDVSTLDSKKE